MSRSNASSSSSSSSGSSIAGSASYSASLRANLPMKDASASRRSLWWHRTTVEQLVWLDPFFIVFFYDGQNAAPCRLACAADARCGETQAFVDLGANDGHPCSGSGEIGRHQRRPPRSRTISSPPLR